MGSRILTFRWLFAIAALFLLTLSSAPALIARELRIENFDAKIIVSPDGTIDVTENIQAHFIGGNWHGLYRSIPVEYETPQHLNYSLFLNIESITDGSGHKLKYESSRERHYRKLKIFIPDADDSTQTISIEYTVSDALRFFEEHDEFYWNITGDEWTVPIESAKATIVLPTNATHIRVNKFTGGYGSRGSNAEAEIVGNGVEVRTSESLSLHEGLTVAIAFDKGAVRAPTVLDRISQILRSNWPLGLPLIVFALMFYLWWTRGRDPRLRPITAQYEPPNQLTPGEAGTLIDDSADMRDITASIVDLAVRGYIVIEEHQKDRMLGLIHDKDYNFILQKDRSSWSELKTHERVLMDGLFTSGTSGETVSMSSLENNFYKSLPGIKSGIFDSLVAQGFYRRRPDSVRSTYIGIGFIVGFLFVWGGSTIASQMGMAPLAFIIGGIASGAIVCAFGWFMPAHTEQGTRAMESILGFEDFLNHVESDRFNRMIKTPQTFEKFLPFAMAFGVEKNWSKAFQGIMTEPPNWYRGSYGPNFFPMGF